MRELPGGVGGEGVEASEPESGGSMSAVMRLDDRVRFIIEERKPHPNPGPLGPWDSTESRIVEGVVTRLLPDVVTARLDDGHVWHVPYNNILDRASTDPIRAQQARWLDDAA